MMYIIWSGHKDWPDSFSQGTTMNTQLAEGLKSAGMIGVITRPAIVATILFGVWRALGRTNVSARARVSAWWWTVVFLAGWLVTVWVLAVRGAFASLSNGSAITQVAFVPLVILILLGATLFAATRSAVLTAALDAAPLSWLVGIQVYRVLGLVFLLAWSRGFLPGYFALPAGIGDALVGVLAIPLALGLRSDSLFVRRLALGWNILGIVDLVNAVSMGVTSAVVQLQTAPSGGSAAAGSPLLLYPLVLVPTFGVPLALILHSLSIRQLRRRGASLTASLLREGTA
jgi:hypothetical protein